MAFSCEENKDNSIPVEFKLRLLDTLGNEKTVFNQGENIVFSFLVVNKSSEDLMFENFFPNDDFFRVYQLNTTEGTTDFGIPYGAILEIGGYQIKANDTLEIKYAWIETENIPNETYFITQHEETNELPTGFYLTYFSSSFNIGYFKTDEKQFEVKFNIK